MSKLFLAPAGIVEADEKFELRASVSPYDEHGGRVPAVTLSLNRGNKPQNKNDNNLYKIPKRVVKSNQRNKNNTSNNNWKRRVSFSESAPRPEITETVTVDYVSPGVGEELFLFIQGQCKTVIKPANQPLIIDPNTVNYVSNKKKGEEEKELWEKLCAESVVTITFDPDTWEVSDIVSVDDTQEWARGLSPPRRRRSTSWGNLSNTNTNTNNNNNNRSGGGKKDKKADWKHGAVKNKNNKYNKKREKAPPPPPSKQDLARRRGSMPSVRELRSPQSFKTSTKPKESAKEDRNGSNVEQRQEAKKDDVISRMERLELANQALQKQLEEANSKIKVLEEKSAKEASPTL